MVNDGRMTTWLPTVGGERDRLVQRVADQRARARRRRPCATISLNRWRSSPRWMASMSAPISSTPYLLEHAVLVQRDGQVERGLAAQGGSSASRTLDAR